MADRNEGLSEDPLIGKENKQVRGLIQREEHRVWLVEAIKKFMWWLAAPALIVSLVRASQEILTWWK